MLEKEILKEVLNKLSIWHSCGDIIWYQRLQSGKLMDQFGRHIMLCPSGTPDIVAIFRNKDYGLCLWFIELKRDSKQKLRPEQEEFKNKYSGFKDIFYSLITDITQLNVFFYKESNDRVGIIKW